MLVQPDHVSDAFADALNEPEKKAHTITAQRSVRTEPLKEGQAVQCLFVGPNDSSGGVISKMQEFAETDTLELAGKHHDVNLSDPRRTGPGDLKTGLRRPVRRHHDYAASACTHSERLGR